MLENWLFRLGLIKRFGGFSNVFKPLAGRIRSFEQLWRIRQSNSTNKAILVFALPKSGSTWIEEMLSVYYELNKFMPHKLVKYESFYKKVIRPY